MVDISQDIEWEQNFEFDQKIQTKVNKQEDDYESSQPPSTTDDDNYNSDDETFRPKKRARRPSNAELIDRVQQQKQEEEEEKSQKIEEKHNDNDNEHENDHENYHENENGCEDIDKDLEIKERELEKEREKFYAEDKHIFIVTWGGRPLYTRHGSLCDRHMTSFMGVVSLFPSNVERVNILTQDDIRSFITYDGVKFIYLLCGPLYFFCITKTMETIQQIRNEMRYYQLLIVMTLTNVFERTLQQSPQFDMRSIFGPTDYMLLEQLVNDTDISPKYLFNSYYPLEISKNMRDEIGNIIKQCKKDCKNKKLLYSLLFMSGVLVTATQPKKRPLHNEDIILLTHFIVNSKSWKQSEVFTPLCLPHFEPSGFVYCYVSYFGKISNESEISDDKEICIIILTLDATSFKKCQLLRKSIEHSLYQSSLIQQIKKCKQLYPFKTSTIMNKILKIINPQVYTFYYNNIKKKQYISPIPIKLYNTPFGKKNLFRRLQHLHNHVHSTPNHQIYFERCNNDSSICKLQENQFEIYIIMNSFVSKKDAQNVLNKLINWINIHSNNLFMNVVNW